KLGGRTYSNYKMILEKEELDGISVCTPPVNHKEITEDVLSEGVNVFCEKPLAMNSREALSMAETAQKNKRLLMTGFKFRFKDEVQNAKRLIEEGKIGKVVLARNMFGGFAEMKERFFSKKNISGGGVLIDNGSHAIDLFRFLLGEVKNVSARINTAIQKIEVEDTAKILMEMENGALVTIDLSWSVPIPSEHYLEIYGSEGTITLPPLRYRRKDAQEWTKYEVQNENVFAKETAHFVNCILKKEKPIVDGLDGLRAQEVIDAAYKSCRENCRVEVKKAEI
ncbi:MAG: hypothetical protein CO162_06225, partial [bacterium (Candidatus Ratteibacteria) CG_4_9_14_3_um_filter_41_21]